MTNPTGQTGGGPTWTLSQFIAGSTYESLPEAVRQRAKLLILDALGCMIGGARTEPGRTVLQLVSSSDCIGPATVWASGQRVPVMHAAYANGYLTNALDFDDTDLGHPGTVIIPPALAVAEQVGASGKALLTAVVMGYEVYVRLTAALRASTERNQEFGGTSSTQLLGVFAATTAAAVLLGLDTSALCCAYGIAAEHAPVPASLMAFLRQRPLSWMKNNAGWVCLGGVLAAKLAQAGFSASPAVFDPQVRLWMRMGSDRYSPEELEGGLGEHYRILDVSLKPYPCCRYLHTTLDALSQIVCDNTLRADEIAHVQIRAFTRLGDFQDFQPQTVVDAQYSIPYAVAMVLLGRQPGHDWLDSASLSDPDVAHMARKVTFVPDPEADHIYFDFDKRCYPTSVTVELTDGTRYESSATIPLGDPRDFMTPKAVVAKFTGLVEPVLRTDAARTLAQRIENVEACESVVMLRRSIYTEEPS